MKVETFRKRQLSFANQAERAVSVLYRSMMKDKISQEDFIQTAGTVIAKASTQATMLADVQTSQLVRRQVHGFGSPVGEAQTVSHFLEDIFTSTEASDDPLPRILRLASSRSWESSRFATQESLKQHGHKFYRWDLSPSPCGLCKFLGRRSWPVEKPPISHPGCWCVVVPEGNQS
jgi:hypothetical protein